MTADSGGGRTAAQFAPLAGGTFTALQLARLYSFPPNADGTGQAIGIIELGGGYQASDLATYFRNQGLRTP